MYQEIVFNSFLFSITQSKDSYKSFKFHLTGSNSDDHSTEVAVVPVPGTRVVVATGTEQTAQPGYELPVLSASEMEQAMSGIPNVDGFLKLLEDDTPIDSHWDLVESFQV